MDESKFGRTKNNLRGTRVEGVWVFGAVEANTDKRRCIVFEVERRNRQTLIPLIQKYIKPETMLHSDGWAVYNTEHLEQLGYMHESVNHTIEYVREDRMHNNTIEGISHLFHYYKVFLILSNILLIRYLDWY